MYAYFFVYCILLYLTKRNEVREKTNTSPLYVMKLKTTVCCLFDNILRCLGIINMHIYLFLWIWFRKSGRRARQRRLLVSFSTVASNVLCVAASFRCSCWLPSKSSRSWQLRFRCRKVRDSPLRLIAFSMFPFSHVSSPSSRRYHTLLSVSLWNFCLDI